MPRKHKTVNVWVTCPKGRCKIRPSVVKVHPGDSIVFKKPKRATVYFQFSGAARSFTAKAASKPKKLKIAKSTRPGKYPYAAFCYEKKAFCTGSSMPIIIVPRLL